MYSFPISRYHKKIRMSHLPDARSEVVRACQTDRTSRDKGKVKGKKDGRALCAADRPEMAPELQCAETRSPICKTARFLGIY
jgi:hypothetical protein